MNRKRFLSGMIMLCLTFVLGLGLSSNATTAKALTQKQAKSKIAALEKDIKKAEKNCFINRSKTKKGRNFCIWRSSLLQSFHFA